MPDGLLVVELVPEEFPVVELVEPVVEFVVELPDVVPVGEPVDVEVVELPAALVPPFPLGRSLLESSDAQPA